MSEHSVEQGLPADGTEVSVATRGMPGVFPGQRAVVRHQSPAGHSNIEHGMVWLECEVRWSHGTAEGFWASRSEYVTAPVVRTCGCGPDDPPCQVVLGGEGGHLYGDGIARTSVTPPAEGRES